MRVLTRIWNKSRVYIFILSILLFVYITYRFYKVDQNRRDIIDKEYVSFLSTQVRKSIGNTLQLSPTLANYMVKLRYFKKFALFDTTGREMFSVAKGTNKIDSSFIKDLINNPPENDSLMLVNGEYLDIIHIKNVLDNSLVGVGILIVTPHFKESYFSFIKKQVYLIGIFLLMLVLVFIKIPERGTLEVSSLDKSTEEEVVPSNATIEGHDEQQQTMKNDYDNTNGNSVVKEIKEKIMTKINDFYIDNNGTFDNFELDGEIGLENDIEMIRSALMALGNNVKPLEESNKRVTNNNRGFLSDIKTELGKVEYFANRLRILSYNAMILANSAGAEGESFKVVADEMANLSEKIFSFQHLLEDKLDDFTFENFIPLIDEISKETGNIERYLNRLKIDKEKENKLLKELALKMNKTRVEEIIKKHNTLLDEFKGFLAELFSNSDFG